MSQIPRQELVALVESACDTAELDDNSRAKLIQVAETATRIARGVYAYGIVDTVGCPLKQAGLDHQLGDKEMTFLYVYDHGTRPFVPWDVWENAKFLEKDRIILEVID